MAGKSGVKVGDVVWANDGGEDFLGLVRKPEHDVNGELKAVIQTPNGGKLVAGYREPEGDSDKGDTFWLV